VLTREARRLTTENNHLHTKLVAAADKLDRFERTTQQVHKRLEQRVSEAVQEKQAAVASCKTLLKENQDVHLHRPNGTHLTGLRLPAICGNHMQLPACLPACLE
jgi:predicted  nucleic acid-binding Zn-ribbon protein